MARRAWLYLLLDRLLDRLDAIDGRLELVTCKLDALTTQGATMAADLSALTTEVQQNGDAVQSAVALIGGLAQQIRDLSADPVALKALADQLDAQTSTLADAVVANTPTPPAPPAPEPAPDPAPPTT